MFLFTATTKRTLYSEKTLGLTAYEARRIKLGEINMNVKALVYHMKAEDVDSLIETTKKFLHCAPCTRDNLDLLKKSLRMLSEANATYDFAPIVMRMFHYFNLPNEALEVCHNRVQYL